MNSPIVPDNHEGTNLLPPKVAGYIFGKNAKHSTKLWQLGAHYRKLLSQIVYKIGHCT